MTTAADPTRSKAATIAAGIASLLGIVVLVAGVPIALWIFGGGSPLPSSIPDWSTITTALTSPDDGTLFIGALKLIGWAAWASFTLCILLEIPARARGLSAPRLPGLRWQQGHAGALVASVVAMIAVLAGPTTALASTTTPHTAQSSTTLSTTHEAPAALAIPIATQTTPTATASISDHSQAAAETATVEVEQVEVVRGDTLWAIAEEHLGDGARYPELFEATSPIQQDDGRYLVDPDLIYPGWEITIPSSGQVAPTGAAEETAADVAESSTETETERTTGDTSAQAQTEDSGGANATGHTLTTPALEAQDGDTASSAPSHPGSSVAAPSTEGAQGSSESTQSAPQLATNPAGELGERDAWPIGLTVAGLGALGAAGLLTVLARHRAAQRRHRRPGRRVALPTGASAIAEAQLRSGADPLAVTDLDRALRTLAAHAINQGVAMPGLRAARICPDSLELYLVDPNFDLPSPFHPVENDPGAWTLERDDLAVLLDEDQALQVPAPYPTLLSLGVDEEDAYLLLNLEEVGALNVISGDPNNARQVLTALTLELLASGWADDTRVSLVGTMPDLADSLGVDRAAYVDHLEDLLPSLEYTARVHREALDGHHLNGPGHARSAGVLEEAWAPQLLVIATPISDSEHQRLTALTQDLPRVAVAAVTSSANPVGEWQLNVAPDDSRAGGMVAHLEPINGLTLTPQHLSDDDYQALLGIFAAADQDDVDGPEWTAGIDDAGSRDIADLPQPEPLEDLTELDTIPGRGDTTDDEGVDDSPPEPELDQTDSVEASTSDDDDNEDTHELDTTSEQEVADQDSGSSDLATDDDSGQPEEHPSPDVVISEPVNESGEGAAAISETTVEDTTQTSEGSETALPPMVRILGNVSIERAAGTQPGAYRRMAEVLAYLGLFPGRSHEAFTEAIFPGERSSAGKRNKYLSQARSWLGTAEDGTPYVALVPEHGYRLHEDVAVDWDIFTSLVGNRIDQAETAQLVAALHLVTGEPLSGVDPKRYEWAQPWKTEAIQAIADVSHEVAHRSLLAGDTRTAARAAAIGLAVEPISEALWRDAMTAAWQSGVPGRAREVISRCHATLSADDLSDLDDETIELMNDIIRDEREHTATPTPAVVGAE